MGAYPSWWSAAGHLFRAFSSVPECPWTGGWGGSQRVPWGKVALATSLLAASYSSWRLCAAPPLPPSMSAGPCVRVLASSHDARGMHFPLIIFLDPDLFQIWSRLKQVCVLSARAFAEEILASSLLWLCGGSRGREQPENVELKGAQLESSLSQNVHLQNVYTVLGRQICFHHCSYSGNNCF